MSIYIYILILSIIFRTFGLIKIKVDVQGWVVEVYEVKTMVYEVKKAMDGAAMSEATEAGTMFADQWLPRGPSRRL